MGDEEKVNRRGFLSMITAAIGGLISAGFIIPGIAYIISPARSTGEGKTWISVGSTAKIEPNTPTLVKLKIERKSGWIVNEEELTAYVLTEDGRNFVAMSNICTHLGCRVRWITDKEQFFCPCHNAVFDKEGKVVSGPPPKPLDRYEVKVENDQLFIFGG